MPEEMIIASLFDRRGLAAGEGYRVPEDGAGSDFQEGTTAAERDR